MKARVCALAALVLVARAAAYTVDCNHEYADCDTELSKLGDEDDQSQLPRTSATEATNKQKTLNDLKIPATTTTTPKPNIITTAKTVSTTEELISSTSSEVNLEPIESKPKPRLLNLNVDDLQSFANALHNQSHQKIEKTLTDLSDVNLDDDEDDSPKIEEHVVNMHKHEHSIPNKFYANLNAPFHTLLGDHNEICKEGGIYYKIGDHVDRECEETCECVTGGVFDCSPRCKHPYIRRGRRLNDPLCFETPVDDCCSIIACATDSNPTKVEVCRYKNETYPVGAKWYVGCEQSCTCEKNSLVTCNPRCPPISQSEKCINVQDPKDACCEVQVCDVSQDVHEEPVDNSTSSTASVNTTTTTTEAMTTDKDYMETIHSLRPLVLTEPIGSVKVLQNNSVQVNLMQINTTSDPIHLLLSDDNGKTFKDVELLHSNLILDLPGGKDYILKTKETGTKFNFTITPSGFKQTENKKEIELMSPNITENIGCYQDGKYYEVGEEFHIGCSELCECTGMNNRECAVLECPTHVGLELISKGCVRWAPNPPASPPNCCPRVARCLSDGTCHYNGVAVPNWSEVPIALTGCEQRCFCENGELDCQEVCSPLPPLPPQSLRCLPGQRPAPLNISDEDCCKHWGCLPNRPMVGIMDGSPFMTVVYDSMPTIQKTMKTYVTPIPPNERLSSLVLPTPPDTTDPIHNYHTSAAINSNKLFSTHPQFKNNVPIYPVTYLPVNFTDFEQKNVKVQNFNLSTNIYHKSFTKKIYPSLSIKDHSNHYIDTDYKALEYEHLTERPQTVSTIYKTVKPNHKTVTTNFFIPTYEKALMAKNYFMLHEGHDTGFSVKRSSENSFNPSDANKNDITSTHLKEKKDLSKVKVNTIAGTVESKTPNPNSNDHSDKLTLMLKTRPTTPKTPYSTSHSKTTVKKHLTELDHIVSLMAVDYEANKNLGRSTYVDHNNNVAGNIDSQNFPTNPPIHQETPPFLPTIPPEILEHELPDDFDQNNIHKRPVNPLGPEVHAVLPAVIPGPSNYGEENKKLSVLSLVADSPTSVKMLFGLPPVLVGLRGSVDLRYTDSADEDVSHWNTQVFAPADEILTTSRLEFRLTGLKPSTTYKIKGKLFLHNLAVEPESKVYSIRTQELPTVAPIQEKRREVDTRLSVVGVNDTTAHVSWRHFTEDELQFIDGIQVRYRPVGTLIYSMTELLHHNRLTAELINLRPSSHYEASIVLIPPPRAVTELNDPATVQFTTSPYVDPYNWSVTVEARSVGAQAAELTWRGVPGPAERWVRVYRAAHACDAAPREHDAFRLAARDLPSTITLTNLAPDTKCRVWLELFLTNGKVKTSNVLEINTKALDSREPVDNVVASSVGGEHGHSNYYGALVVVGVVAALGALTSLLLLLVLLQRQRPRSVSITALPTAPRESSLPPYDNPAYKLELQQETMDL